MVTRGLSERHGLRAVHLSPRGVESRRQVLAK